MLNDVSGKNFQLFKILLSVFKVRTLAENMYSKNISPANDTSIELKVFQDIDKIVDKLNSEITIK